MAQADPSLAGTALYHCQQAAEKALKGFLVFHGQVFRKTHSIAEIGLQAVGQDASLESLIKRAASLSDNVWKLRYPGTPFGPTMAEAQSGITLAAEVVSAIGSRLPGPTV